MRSPVRIIVSACVAAWLAATAISVVTADGPRATANPSDAGPRQPVPVMGLAGCAARGCHGGPTMSPDGKSLRTPTDENACSYWLRFDRHANAYQVLRNDRSMRMVALLAGGKPHKPAYEDARCLACHVTPALAELEPTQEVRRLRSEGVSCDACHTAPGHSTAEWIDPHKRGWDAKSGVDWYAAHGMRYVGTAATRAETCAGCHVGAPAAPEHGIPLREVNHDLIAAGHPRLNFEYSTYLALMPPHWSGPDHDNTGAEMPAPPKGRDVLEWYHGQLETAAAGLTLLADQAEPKTGRIWPELAAFNCYACHFDIIPNMPAGVDFHKHHGDRPGRAPWAGANVSDPLREVLRDDQSFTEPYSTLRMRMDDLRTRGEGIVRVADQLSGQCRDLARRPPPEEFQGPRAGLELVRTLHLTDRGLDLLDWDAAAQTYYALQAANRSRHRNGRDDEAKSADDIDQVLGEIKGHLRLPRVVTGGDTKASYNSPVGYDPAVVAPLFLRLPEMFEAWYAKSGLKAGR